MVLSNLEKGIDYVEHKKIFFDDDNVTAEVYLMQVEFESEKMVEFEVVLGKPRQIYKEYEIMQIPIYIVQGDDVKESIGLFEFRFGEMDTTLLNSDVFELEKLGKPLFFTSYVNERYLESFSNSNVALLNDDIPGVEEVDLDDIEADKQVDDIQEDNDDDNI